MPKKRFSPERIVMLLCQIKMSIVQGKATAAAWRDAGNQRRIA
jgi:hypothetical protein